MNRNDPTLKDLYESVGTWHGTGRYKYQNGEVTDILEGILNSGALTPYTDTWDQKRPNSESISATRSRSYARLYASLFFPPGQRSLKELWNRFIWSCKYFIPSKWVAWQEYAPPRPHIVDYKTKVVAWTAKLARKPQSFLYLFLWGGTDIPSNYPILIGIKRAAYTPTQGSRFIDLHEDRSATSILLKDFTHIEVPERQVLATRQALEAAGYDLPVIALEASDKVYP